MLQLPKVLNSFVHINLKSEIDIKVSRRYRSGFKNCTRVFQSGYVHRKENYAAVFSKSVAFSNSTLLRGILLNLMNHNNMYTPSAPTFHFISSIFDL